MTAGSERRLAPRRAVDLPPAAMHARIRPGFVVRVRDISSGGVRIASSRRLTPGMHVELVLEHDVHAHRSRARVVHSCVASLGPDDIVFESGLSLENRLPGAMLDAIDGGVATT